MTTLGTAARIVSRATRPRVGRQLPVTISELGVCGVAIPGPGLTTQRPSELLLDGQPIRLQETETFAAEPTVSARSERGARSIAPPLPEPAVVASPDGSAYYEAPTYVRPPAIADLTVPIEAWPVAKDRQGARATTFITHDSSARSLPVAELDSQQSVAETQWSAVEPLAEHSMRGLSNRPTIVERGLPREPLPSVEPAASSRDNPPPVTIDRIEIITMAPTPSPSDPFALVGARRDGSRRRRGND
jgi:hypothetical protein